MKHPCKHHRKPTDLDKVKLQLALKAKLEPSDPKLFYADTLACHPMAGDECWVYFHHYHFVARGVILKKTPGTSDTHATWHIRITYIDGDKYLYYKNLRETFVRSQIWPTKKDCYAALYGHLEQKMIQNERANKEFSKRCTEIERFMG